MLKLNPEEKAQIQLERLQSVLNRAYKNVPFHQNRFQENGIDPAQIERIQDLAKIPFMQRKHLAEHYPYGLFAVPLRDIVRIHTAPGTTLNPTVSGYTRSDLLVWQEMVSRALNAAGVTAHDILQISLDAGLANWGRDYKNGAEAIGTSVIPDTPLSLEKQLMVLRDYKTSVLITTPSAALQLAGQMFKSEMNPIGLNLKTLVLVGDPAPAETRRQLEEQLYVSTWVHYGLSEVPGPAVAFECERHNGLHVNEDHFIPEIIDPETGHVLADGQAGELILTTLTTRALPLIRFRTGDRALLIRDACPCGSLLTRMQWFSERTDDILSIRGVKVHRQQILLHMQRALGVAPTCYRYLIKSRATANYLEVSICVDDRLFSDEIKVLEKLIQSVQETLHENIGVPVVLRLKEKRSFDLLEL